MNRSLPALALASASLAAPALAEEATFDFQDPKGVNGVAFIADSQLEPFVGFAHGVAGQVSFDPDAPDAFTGRISVDAQTMEVTNETMTEHMRSPGWVNATEGARFVATFDSVEQVSTSDDGASVMQIAGTLQYGPISVDKTYTVEATLVPDGAEARGPKTASGDLLVLRSDFTVDRTDFGIKPEMSGEAVGTQIHVMVRITGYEADASGS